MADRPILFSAPMVRALLEGRKTQTRRLATFVTPDRDGFWHIRGPKALGGIAMADDATVRQFGANYYRAQPSDRLWVRENVYQFGGPIEYPADGEPSFERKMTPCIHMPKTLSRLTLAVTDVRVERLNDCTEEDALAEGVIEDPKKGFWVPGVEHPNKDFPYLSRPTAREMYAALWDTINGSGEWLSNPWVVAISFTVEKRNIDQ